MALFHYFVFVPLLSADRSQDPRGRRKKEKVFWPARTRSKSTKRWVPCAIFRCRIHEWTSRTPHPRFRRLGGLKCAHSARRKVRGCVVDGAACRLGNVGNDFVDFTLAVARTVGASTRIPSLLGPHWPKVYFDSVNGDCVVSFARPVDDLRNSSYGSPRRENPFACTQNYRGGFGTSYAGPSEYILCFERRRFRLCPPTVPFLVTLGVDARFQGP